MRRKEVLHSAVVHAAAVVLVMPTIHKTSIRNGCTIALRWIGSSKQR